MSLSEKDIKILKQNIKIAYWVSWDNNKDSGFGLVESFDDDNIVVVKTDKMTDKINDRKNIPWKCITFCKERTTPIERVI